MKSPLSRRAFIGSTGVALAGASFVGYQTFVPASNPKKAIAEYIARLVPDLQPDSPVVSAFAADATEYMSKRFIDNFKIHIALMSNPLMTNMLDTARAKKQRYFEQLLITTFMRSTDYFTASAEKREPSYIVFADPYSAGCSNPMAIFVS